MIDPVGMQGIPRWAYQPMEALPNRGLQNAASRHLEKSSSLLPIPSASPFEAVAGRKSASSISALSGANDLSNILSGALDALELSPEAEKRLQISKVEFQIDYQILRSLNPENGSETIEIRFGFRGSIEAIRALSGSVPSEPTAESAAPSPADSILDYFSPEKTAGRILDFALGFFPMSRQYKEEGGDVETARQAFADFIGTAIQKGFDQAKSLLGPIAQEVRDHIDTTHEIVFAGLKDFVANGRDASSKATPTRTDLQQYAMELTLSYQRTSVVMNRAVYNAQGRVESPTASEQLDLVA